MAKNKYNPETFPALAESYARDGLNDTQIAKNLGIAVSSFYNYQREFQEFQQAVERGKKPINFEVENALLKLARGFEYTEILKEKTNQGDRTIYTDTGAETVPKIKKTIRKTLKTVPPNLGAIKMWLFNKCREKWAASTNFVDQFGPIEAELNAMTEDQLDKEIELMEKSETMETGVKSNRAKKDGVY